MATRDEEAGLRIGEALKRARTRQELDIRTAEAETKIRVKYLRALENEEWEILPGHAYAKGFLRTYAQFLGLDGGALVDEYRRRVESSLGAGAPVTFTEPVLERRRRPGQGSARRWSTRLAVIGGVAAAAIATLVILAVAGSDDDPTNRRHRAVNQGPRSGQEGSQGQGSGSEPVTLSLMTRGDMLVCLVPGHGRPLIDSQTLIAGTREGPFQPPADNYRLDLESGGVLTLTVDGKRQTLRSDQPASFAIDSNGVRPTSFAGPNCP